ncbi:LbetaH domain-containing protein [Fodinicola feengrottensis]|uniref:Acyltransferase n=1 Tax=Fodinicola feengrottensis TaxID=435914 RepID=A0ABN2HNK9_9ACTN|nr:hypothetical protein [Fodinicola feengrottensis]
MGEQEDTLIRAPLRIEYGSLLWVGARTFINNEALIIDCAPVHIGSDVQIGPRVLRTVQTGGRTEGIPEPW